MQREDEEFEVVEFKLQSTSGEGETLNVEEGLVQEKLNVKERCLPENIDRRSHLHLLDIDVPDVRIKKVSVLIGKDVGETHEVLKVRNSNGPGSQLQAQRGLLGWVIIGTILGSPNHSEVNVHFTEKIA